MGFKETGERGFGTWGGGGGEWGLECVRCFRATHSKEGFLFGQTRAWRVQSGQLHALGEASEGFRKLSISPLVSHDVPQSSLIRGARRFKKGGGGGKGTPLGSSEVSLRGVTGTQKRGFMGIRKRGTAKKKRIKT